ncbi:MAG: phosphatase PAP2 family protein [Bacteroidales bacterium]|nr:phosphatase PAP2 family protein [Bacteroidales bacterium]
MRTEIKILTPLVFFFCSLGALRAQNADSVNLSLPAGNFHYTQLCSPIVLTSLGSLGLFVEDFKSLNDGYNDFFMENDFAKTKVDDYLQYSPIVLTYALKVCGVKTKSNYIDMTVMLGTSALMTLGITGILKLSISEMRPDNRADNSFPSGHTATAFMGAEFMRQELGGWYGVAGYTLATCTGVLRMYNHRHWLTDILAGAGIGILCTRISYWTYPQVKKLIQNKKKNVSALGLPYVCDKGGGIVVFTVF